MDHLLQEVFVPISFTEDPLQSVWWGVTHNIAEYPIARNPLHPGRGTLETKFQHWARLLYLV